MISDADKEKIKVKWENIFLEVKAIGWQGILKTYHPDIICDYQEAFKIFSFYKRIYQECFVEGKKNVNFNSEDQELLLNLYKIGKI